MSELKLKDVVMLTSKNALAVLPKEPFIKWLKDIDNTIDLDDVKKEKQIYIIPSLDIPDDENLNAYLKANFNKIFATELCGWYTDPRMWPKEISYEIFKEWFEVEFHDAVYDIEKREKDIF